MIFKGKAWKFKDDLNTDEIIPARYLNITDAVELGKHCMETIHPLFSKTVQNGDIIVAGRNFGCGSSREHAPLSIKGCQVGCVIAKGFARIFFRNAINTGLPILESAQAADEIREGDEIEVDLEKGQIRNLTRNKIYQSAPFPKFMQELIKAGGLLNYLVH